MSAGATIQVDAYSKNESDERYEPKGSGGNSGYSKAEIDEKFATVEDQFTEVDEATSTLDGRVDGHDTALTEHDLRLDALEDGGGNPAPPGTTNTPYIWFDGLGATDDERVEEMNRIARDHGGNPTPTFEWAIRRYEISRPIELWSGLRKQGNNGMPAREFGRGTVVKWRGSGGMYRYPGSQTNQGYPSDGSPRNIELRGFQWEGAAGQDLFEKVDPGLAFNLSDGKRLWYCSIQACGVVGFDTVLWGYGTGCDFFSDNSHMQAVINTALKLAGSENSVYGGPGRFLQDSSTSAWAGSNKPFLISRMEKSSILDSMLSARGNSYQILLETGSDIQLIRVQFDAPDGSPTQGAPLRITGGSDYSIAHCGFKGHMTNPGASGSRGIIDVFGGDRIVVLDNHFQRKGNSQPSVDTPLIVSSGAKVKVGLNNFGGYSGKVKGNASSYPAILDPTISLVALTSRERARIKEEREARKAEAVANEKLLDAYRAYRDRERNTDGGD